MDETQDETVQREVKKQVIITTFTIGTAVALYFLSSPDALKTVKMWTALKTKRLAQFQVDMWQRLADYAATAYNKEKN